MPKKVEYSHYAHSLNGKTLEVLTEIKEQQDLSFQDIQNLSVNSKMNHTMICRYFNGKYRLDLIGFIEICRLLNVNEIDVSKEAKKRLNEV